MKKILAVGNYTDAMYHGFSGVDERLKAILSGYELICTDQTEKLLTLKQDKTAGVISYLDIWNSTLTDEEAQALDSFVRQGGAAVLLHNGISIQGQSCLEQLAGGRFLTHPPMEELRFAVKPHELTGGCEGFCLSEEPYQFELEEDGKEIILTYDYRDKEYVGGWCKTYGQGRVVFLMPGHTPEIFDCLAYRKLIRQSMEWALADQS